MAAVWVLVRSGLRRRWRSAAGVALVLGLAGGLVLGAAAGARRTDTAYSRLLAFERPPDAAIGSVGLFGFGRVDLDRVAALPEVTDSARCADYSFVPTQRGRLYPVGQGDGRVCGSSGGLGLGRFKVLEGRLADPSRPDEVILGYASSAQMEGALHLRVGPGSTFTARFLRPGVDPSVLQAGAAATPPGVFAGSRTFRIVGIVVDPEALTADGEYGAVYFTQAFDREASGRFENAPGIAVRLRHGQADAFRFSNDVDRLARGGPVGAAAFGDAARITQNQLHPLAVALWIFAALAALVGLLVVGQALARQQFLDGIEHPTLRALGFSRGQLFAGGILRSVLIGAAAAVVAAAVAVGLSPFTPFGRARIVEPHPGLSVDAPVLALGVLAFIAAAVAVGVIPAWRAAAARGDQQGVIVPESALRPSWVVGALADAGAPPTVTSGVRMALLPGRGRTAVPVWTTMVGLALAVAAMVGAFTFGSSFDRLLSTPRLSGWDWDVGLGNPYSGDLAGRAIPLLRRDHFVGEFSGGNIITPVDFRAEGRSTRVTVWAIDTVRGRVTPSVVAGTWPGDDTEVALGSKTMQDLRIGLGDTVHARVGARTLDMRVTARVVLPEGGGAESLGQGGGMTFDALRALVPRAPENVFPVRLRPGVDHGAALRSLSRVGRQIGGTPVEGPALAEDLGNVGRVRRLPLVLAVGLALIAAATLAHALASAVRRRRRDLALLKTLGFVRRQVWSTVAWQATTTAVVALAIGVPIGLAAGRWAWNAFAGALGVVPDPVVPALIALAVAAGTFLVANLVAAMPGLRAARTNPARALRAE